MTDIVLVKGNSVDSGHSLKLECIAFQCRL